jgi:hypothetical protein
MMLIDRDSLKHQIIETYEYEFPTASGAFDEFVTKIIPNIINNAPTIDAVPVVRCGECEYYQDNNGGYPHGECRWGHDETPDADDYCSYGERKESEGST